MYLAEAIKEKEFMNNSIDSLCNRINFLSIVTDETVVKLNIELVKNKVKELENLYKELQKYTIIIDRAKAKSVIVLNGENFSIADAENILITMGIRLAFLVNLLDSIGNTNLNPKLFICVDVNEIESRISSLRDDMKIIEIGIEKSLWNIEV